MGVHRVTGRHLAAAILVLLAVGWALINGPVEGPVLWSLTPAHGFTVADLASVAAVMVAAVLVWPRRR